MKEKNKPIINNIFILKYIWQVCPIRIILQLFNSVLLSVMNIYFTVFFLQIIFNFYEKKLLFKNLCLIIITSLIIKAAITLYSNWFINIYAQKTNVEIYEYINEKLFEKIRGIDISCYEDTEFYSNYTKAASEANDRAIKVLNICVDIITQSFSILILLITILNMDIISALIAIFPMSIVILFNNKLNKITYNLDMKNIESNRVIDYCKRVIYIKDYAKEIRTSNIAVLIMEKYNDAVKELNKNIKKYGYMIGFIVFIWNTASNNLMLNIAYIYSFIQFINNTILLGDFIAYVNSINNIGWNFFNLTENLVELKKSSLYIEKLRLFMEYQPLIKENQHGKIVNEKEKFKICFSNVSFKYKEDSDYILKNINIEINQGEKIAIVGLNGAGKTTLIKLFLRLYDATLGEITFNNINIRNYNLASYRKQYSTVFQDFKLFSISIAENILMKNIQKEDHELIDYVLKEVGLDIKFSDDKKKYDAILTREFDDNGIILSGGECQKIALARLLSSKSRILILDEPTSSLDPVAEHDFINKIMEKNETIIFISHRLSEVLLANRIYVLEDGKIIEVGSHNELMKSKNKYYEMFMMQAKSYL